jgi:putative SbcD/Mre11-related phosphoesterase
MRALGEWLLTAARLAVHLPTATGVVADLHLGYAEARAQSGEAVPVTDLGRLLAPLGAALAAHGARRLVVAGDLFEAGPRADLAAGLRAWLDALGVELAVVPGNHDRGLTEALGLPLWPGGCAVGAWLVVHGDGARPPGRTVQGHEHPCVRWGRLTAPCYLFAEDRLILPAFSPDAAGVNVLRSPAWSGLRCGVIVGGEVLDFRTVGELRLRMAEGGQNPPLRQGAPGP